MVSRLIFYIAGVASGYVYDGDAPVSQQPSSKGPSYSSEQPSSQQPSFSPKQLPTPELFAPTQHVKCPTIEEMKQLKSHGQWQVMEGTTANGLQWVDVGSRPVTMDAGTEWARSAAVAPIEDHGPPGFVCYLTADNDGPAIQAAITTPASTCTFNGTKLPKSRGKNGFILGWTFCSGPSCVLECT